MVPQRTTVTLSERNYLAFGKHSNILGPVGPDDKQSVCNAGNPGSIPSSGRSPGGGNLLNLLKYFCLGNPMDRGAW